MAGITQIDDRPSGAPAPPEGFTVVLPEGLSLERLVELGGGAGGGEPEPHETPDTPAPAPSPAPAPAPAPATPAGEHRAAPPGVLAERRKRQAMAMRLAALEAQSDAERLANEQRLATQRPRVTLTPQQRAEVIKKANDAESMGDAAAIAMDTMLAAINSTPAVDPKAERARRDEEVRRMEDAMKAQCRERGENYVELLERAGIYKHVTEGTAVGRDIMLAPNPAQRAYDYAVARLEELGELPPSNPAPASPAPAAPAPRPASQPAGRAPEDAPRRPAAPPSITDLKTERGRGISAFPTSGGPARATIWDRAFLDNVMRTDYNAYRALLRKNPGLEEFHDGE